MNDILDESPLYCPCCGESVSVLVDISLGAQEYIEDCEVCCRPMIITVQLSEEEEDLVVHARSEDA